MPEDTDIVVRERMRSCRDVVLVRDVSGSIRGEQVRMAALPADLVEDRPAVVAFWSAAALLIPLDAHVPAARLLDQLLRIPARVLTDVHLALTVAHAGLSRSSARQRSAVLGSPGSPRTARWPPAVNLPGWVSGRCAGCSGVRRSPGRRPRGV